MTSLRAGRPPYTQPPPLGIRQQGPNHFPTCFNNTPEGALSGDRQRTMEEADQAVMIGILAMAHRDVVLIG